MGFAVGLVADTELPEYLGLHALALSAIGYVTAGVWGHLVRASLVVQCLVLFGAVLLHDAIYYVVYYRNHMDMFGRFFVRFGLPGALYTAALGILVYMLARSRGWRGIADGGQG
jgi:rod shape-determining protein MreD